MKMHLAVKGKWCGLEKWAEDFKPGAPVLFLAVTGYLSDPEQQLYLNAKDPNRLFLPSSMAVRG